MRVFVTYWTRSKIVSPGNDVESREVHTESTITGVTTKQPKDFYYNLVDVKDFEVDLPKKVYVVCIQYTSWDTFSEEKGCLSFEGVYISEEKALRIREQIEDGDYEGDEFPFWDSWGGELEHVYVKEIEVEE